MGAQQQLQIGMREHRLGNLVAADQIYRELVAANPRIAFAWHLRALVAYQQGDADTGLEFIDRAIELEPEVAAFHANRGNLLRALGEPDLAVTAHRRAVEFDPRNAEFLTNLGNAYRDLHDLSEAERCYREAVALEPHSASMLCNLGVVLHELGRHQEALDAYRRATTMQPRNATGWYNLANLLYARGEYDEAIKSYRAAVEIAPGLHDGWYNLGNALSANREAAKAVDAYREALKCRRDHYPSALNLGNALQQIGHLEDAVVCYRRVLDLKPDHAVAHYVLGNALQGLSRPVEAEEHYEIALNLDPSHLRAYHMRNGALYNQGRIGDALLISDEEMLRKSGVGTYSNALMMTNYFDEMDPAEVLARHRGFDRAFAAPLPPPAPHENSPDATRRLRIGYVSADLRRHSVAFFIEPALANCDHSGFEIFCYANLKDEDEVSKRLQSCAEGWLRCEEMNDEALAERIRDDRIDILVDLAGHTAGARLLAFARKPAPVQATFLGYPTTTGLSAIDYRITDWHVDPEGSEAHNQEVPIRLPCSYFCYRPLPDAPDVGPLPAERHSAITFGSFNNIAKISPSVLPLWAEVLRAVPGSRLLLKTKNLADASVRARIVARLGELGVDIDRVILREWEAGTVGHLAAYHEVDIALDTFPYNGATTTCESLWMGVPVASLSGHTHASRMGRSILVAAGFPELVADAPQEFARIAIALASDRSRLASLRAEMRSRLRASSLMNEAAFTRALEAAYRTMWENWCRTQTH